MITLIAAVSKNGCIGRNGQLPWYLPEDLKHFKKLTTGNVVLMGRKTWESIPEKFRPLPNRMNVVVTRQRDYHVPPGVVLSPSINDALAAHAADHVFIVGGGEMYRQVIDRADVLEITHVDQAIDGDIFFPEIDPAAWREKEREPHNGFSFVRYERTSHSH